MPDTVARLVSRALVPAEVRTAWDVPDYVSLLDRDDLDADLDRLVARARAARRLDPERLRALLAALAAPPAAELNRARLAAASGIPVTTLPPYVDLLVDLGVLRLLDGSRAAVVKRAIGRPVVVFTDPALARHLSGDRAADLLAFAGRGRLAPHLRGVVIDALLRQQPTSVIDHRLGHLRERNGLAVDVLIELPDETVIGVEVRTAASLRPHQFARLDALAARAGPRFRGGVVLNTAARGHRYRPGLISLPVAMVWEN